MSGSAFAGTGGATSTVTWAESTQVPSVVVPELLPKVTPVHQVVDVDVFVPGCPPNAQKILFVVSELLAGRIPDLGEQARFG